MKYELGRAYFIRPLRSEDLLEEYLNWFEDPDVCQFNSHGVLPKVSRDKADFLSELDSSSSLTWGIFHDQDGHVGNASLQSISWVSRTAEFAIIIGEKPHWNKGLGRLVLDAVINHGFNKMNLERIFLATAATNTAMVNLAKSLGFQLEGSLRKHLFLDGSRVDAVVYGLLKNEFRSEASQ